MLRDGFPRRGGTRDGVEECSLSRLLLKGMGLDVARMLRPFNPGDCNTAGRGFNSRKQMKISKDQKLRKIRMKRASGFGIMRFILSLLIFVTPTFVLEPCGGSATSPSHYGAGRDLTHWPSCRAGRPQEQGGRANKFGALAVGPVALTPDPRSAVKGGRQP